MRSKGKTNGMNDKSSSAAHPNMHPVINMLVQLQDLLLIRSEQEAVLSNGRLSQLDATILQLRSGLPPETAQLFQKIEKKDLLVIVPISNNVCTGCGLILPVSLVHAVRAGEKLQQCPNCARILYYQNFLPRRVSKKMGGRFTPRRTGIARFTSPELMIPSLKATERDNVIAELAGRMVEKGFVDNGAKLLDEALKREAIMHTAVEHGLAFPHVRGVEGGGLTLALGISRKGIKFENSSRSLSYIIFFIVIPTAASVFYLRLLAGLTQSFLKKDARDKLMRARTQEELWGNLLKATRTTIK
jgi:mannitol/fructose-specific phosphotransferase system IIA component (Ntr-type)